MKPVSRTVDRYLVREHLKPSIYCLIAFSLVFIILDLFDNLSHFMEAGTPLLLVLRYYLSLLAPSLEYIVPASLMLATLYTLWQLTRNNEITAMRASGMSLYRLMLPFILIGVVFSVGTGLIKEFVAPQASAWTEEFKQNGYELLPSRPVRDVALFNIVEHRNWSIQEMDMKRPHILHGVQLKQERADLSRVSETFAPRAEYLDGSWWFYDLRIQRYDSNDNPIDSGDAAVVGAGSVREMAHLTEQPEDFLAEKRGWAYLSGREMARYIKRRPNMSHRNRADRMYDLHARIAMPWACLIVTLFAIPTGIKTGRQSVLNGIFITLSLFFLFYFFAQMGMFFGKSGQVPAWVGAWLPNLIFLAGGFAMTTRLRFQ